MVNKKYEGPLTENKFLLKSKEILISRSPYRKDFKPMKLKKNCFFQEKAEEPEVLITSWFQKDEIIKKGKTMVEAEGLEFNA